MKLWRALAFGCWAVSAFAGQAHLPATEYHDFIQRNFVVELARVMAWRENLRQPAIAEIVYEVRLDPQRQTVWDVKWLNAQGEPVRVFQVTYLETLLTQGPEFYRAVFAQIAGKIDPAPVGLVESFWGGAESAGVSRVEGLRAAFKLDPSKPENAPRLAGLLSHTALHSESYAVTLDAQLLARAAAWLCLSEAMAGEKVDSLWSPFLFLAGRERDASKAWKSDKRSALKSWWDLMLHEPTSRQVFRFAASPKGKPFAMPFLASVSRMESSDARTLAAVLPPLFRDEIYRLYDYATLMDREAGVAGGRILEGQWPALARKAWVEALGEFVPGPLDYREYADDLKKAQQDLAVSQPPRADASLEGFEAVVPLLERGYNAGWGKLIPVATVTARDLLNYGWESTGVQMGRRHMFVNESWGVPERAQRIAEPVLRLVSGMDAFLKLKSYNGAKKLLDDVSRVEGVDLLGYRVGLNFVHDHQAELFYRHCWLRAGLIKHQCRTLWNGGAGNGLIAFAKRTHAEGGAACDAELLQTFLFTLKAASDREELQFAGKREMEKELSEALPDCTTAAFEVYSKNAKEADRAPFEMAQTLEKLYWRKPGSEGYDTVFRNYLKAHAYAAAKRFYEQSEPLIDNRVGLSNTMGPERCTLALLEGDGPAVEQAQRASATGSATAMIMNLIVCATRDDVAGVEAQLAGYRERYGDVGDEKLNRKADAQRLKEFIPLWPAFREAAHPDHEKALDHLKFCTKWPTLQWMLLRNAKLNRADAVRFLGGVETDPDRRLLVFYLQRDKESFEKTYKTIKTSPRMLSVVIQYLRNELLEIPVPPDQPDLKPADAESVTETVLKQLRHR